MTYSVKSIIFLILATAFIFNTMYGMAFKEKKIENMVNIVALMKAKEGKYSELRNALLAIVKPARSENSCLLLALFLPSVMMLQILNTTVIILLLYLPMVFPKNQNRKDSF